MNVSQISMTNSMCSITLLVNIIVAGFPNKSHERNSTIDRLVHELIKLISGILINRSSAIIRIFKDNNYSICT